MDFQIEYRRCTCPAFEQKLPRVAGDRGIQDPGREAPDYFENEGWAVRRFREIKLSGKTPRVHIGNPGHSYLHIKAVVVNGERLEE